ncbi:MAG: redoxin domain-containing protein [Acidobacteriaceae bacterium]|nr:redoxin domain-containing protein [Acidobacteriaceae bacterium]
MIALDAGLLGARALLAGIFLLAGISKLLDLERSRRAVAGFGVPERLAHFAGLWLPIFECLIAAALLPGGASWLGSLASLGLLSLFVAGIAINMARGRKPECNCFGQLHSAPVGWSTLARSILLSGVALFVALGEQGRSSPSFAAWLGVNPVQTALTLLGIVATLLLMLQVLKQQGRILLRLEAMESGMNQRATSEPKPSTPAPSPQGLPVGTRAPAFRLTALDGVEWSLEGLLRRGKPVLLLFTNPGCGPCMSLLRDISQWAREAADTLSIVLISEGSKSQNLEKVGNAFAVPVLLQANREIAEAYQAYGTPAALVVRTDGTIGSPVAMGVDRVRELALRIVQRSKGAQNGGLAAASSVMLQSGDLIPSVPLQNVDGALIGLSDLVAKNRTLIVFWNPACGFCQRMLEELREWDTNRSADSPGLVVVSSGTVAQNREMRLISPVLSDPQSRVSTQFGARGTPMAVLIDSGRIASSVVAGKQDIFALASEFAATAAMSI